MGAVVDGAADAGEQGGLGDGFSSRSIWLAKAPLLSRIGWAYPDMYRTGRAGRMACTRLATSLPSISGMTTSVSSRSMGCPVSPAMPGVSAAVRAART